jgi:hypothetical protein
MHIKSSAATKEAALGNAFKFNYKRGKNYEQGEGLGRVFVPARSSLGSGFNTDIRDGTMGGMGAVDSYGNTITYDVNGAAILNYADGYPTTDSLGNPLPDPGATMLSTSGTPLAPAPGASVTTPATSLINTLTNSLTSFLTRVTPGAATAATPVAAPTTFMGMSPTMLGVLGIVGFFGIKAMGKKSRH